MDISARIPALRRSERFENTVGGWVEGNKYCQVQSRGDRRPRCRCCVAEGRVGVSACVGV